MTEPWSCSQRMKPIDRSPGERHEMPSTQYEVFVPYAQDQPSWLCSMMQCSLLVLKSVRIRLSVRGRWLCTPFLSYLPPLHFLISAPTVSFFGATVKCTQPIHIHSAFSWVHTFGQIPLITFHGSTQIHLLNEVFIYTFLPLPSKATFETSWTVFS